MGSKGIKGIVVPFRGGSPGLSDLQFTATIDTTLVAGMREDSHRRVWFSEVAIEEAADAVETLFEQVQFGHGVPPDHIFLVGSSSLPAAANRDLLVAELGARVGKTIQFIELKVEIERLLRGVVPERHQRRALVIDVGSGTTKVGFLVRDGDLKDIGADLPGTVRFADRIEATRREGEPFEAAAERGLREWYLENEDLHAWIEMQPGFRNRNLVYLTGGAAWALVTLHCPERGYGQLFVELTPADFEEFHAELVASRDIPVPDLSAIHDRAMRESIESEVGRVLDTFKREHLIAGVDILRGLADEGVFRWPHNGNTRPPDGRWRPEEGIYFARAGYIGWLLAFIREDALSRASRRGP